MTLPAENQARSEAPTVAKLQQTVEAALPRRPTGHEEAGCTLGVCAVYAALRDLVAQAELVGEMADLIASHHSCTNMGCQFCALLARLDGAR